jgi:predicted ATPase with chaperone activity
VSLAAYTAMLDWQTARRRPPTLERVQATVNAQLVLPEQAVEVAALAASSARSLFVFGPPGNGKTSLGRLLHAVTEGDLWVPYCITVDGTIIRIFDRQVHQPIDGEEGGRTAKPSAFDRAAPVDRRWVRVRPPFVVAGGEMTIAELDLAYSPSHRFYEAPPHVKANGGTFLIDDFGRQRIAPHELLNRWIIPLEHRVDHLTLHTGQKIEIPFRLMLIVATNLPLNEVADPAFLRRMGYRLQLPAPTAEQWADVFRRYARSAGVEVPAGLTESLLKRYEIEGRDLRASEPRDLIERARDLCRLRRRAFALDRDVMDTAWAAYFGHPTRASS